MLSDTHTHFWCVQAVDHEAKGRPWEWRQQHANQWRNLNNDQEMPSIRLKASRSS